MISELQMEENHGKDMLKRNTMTVRDHVHSQWAIV